jgi:hypothetical protein
MCAAQLRQLQRVTAALALCSAMARFAAAQPVAPLAPVASPAPQLTLSLHYEVDAALEGCPSEAEFRRSVIEQLGYDPFRDAAPHHVLAELHEDSGLAGSVVWTDSSGRQEGERQFATPSRDCAELAKAVSFSVAVQVQLLNGSSAADSARPVTARERQPPVPLAAARSVPSQPDRPRLPPDFLSVGLGPTVDFGGAPAPQAGARLFVAARAGALSLELAALGTLPVRKTLPDGSGFSIRSFGLSLSPCGQRGNFALCAVGRVARLGAQGFGVDDARAPATFTAQAALRLGFQQGLTERWLLGAHTDGLVLLTPGTVYLNAVPVWSTPRLALSLGIDLSLIFK